MNAAADPTVTLDIEAIADLRMVFGDARLALFVDAFLDDLRVRSELLLAAVACADFEAVRVDAHRIKGAAAYFGPTDVTDIADAIEHAERDQMPFLVNALGLAANRLDRALRATFLSLRP